MTQHYCQRMAWRTWLLFHSRIALMSPSLNSFLICSATKEREHDCESRFPQKISCSPVVRAWTSPWMDLHRKGELSHQGLRCLCLLCIWRCPMANTRFCSLYHLCKHQLKELLNLAVIGKPWAYLLAASCSKDLQSLIWAKVYLFDAVTGALEAWKIPTWFPGMWGPLLELAKNWEHISVEMIELSYRTWAFRNHLGFKCLSILI